MQEVKEVINFQIDPKKTLGCYFITGRIINKTNLHVLQSGTTKWNISTSMKMANIILLTKPDKPKEDVKSYRTFDLLLWLSEVTERILLTLKFNQSYWKST